MVACVALALAAPHRSLLTHVRLLLLLLLYRLLERLHQLSLLVLPLLAHVLLHILSRDHLTQLDQARLVFQ